MNTDTFKFENGVLFSKTQIIRIMDFYSLDYKERQKKLELISSNAIISIKVSKELFNEVVGYYVVNTQEKEECLKNTL